MTQFSDTLRLGDAYYAAANQSLGGNLGSAVNQVTVQQFGAVVTADDDGVVVAATATQAQYLPVTGALATASVATFDVARSVSLTATGNISTATVTITGTDYYGQPQTENIIAPNATTVHTVKTYKTVTRVYVGSSIATAPLTVGSSNKLGLKHHLLSKGAVISLGIDGNSEIATVVAGETATGVATATTPDTRGTVSATLVPNSARLFTVSYVIDPSSKVNLYGQTPA